MSSEWEWGEGGLSQIINTIYFQGNCTESSVCLLKFIFWKENIYVILKCCELVQNLLDIASKLSEE